MPLDHYIASNGPGSISTIHIDAAGIRVLAITNACGSAEGPHPPATTSRGLMSICENRLMFQNAGEFAPAHIAPTDGRRGFRAPRLEQGSI